MNNADSYFCPIPTKWNDIYSALLRIWETAGSSPNDKPPIPLILAAWYDTPGLMKLLRWKDTISWAEKHNCAHLTELKDDEKFRG